MNFSCYLCKKNFKDQENYLRHIDNHKEGLSFVLYKSAFDRAIKIFRKHFKNYFSLNDILNEVNDIRNLFDVQLLEYPKYKCSILIQVEYLLKGTANTVLEKEIFNIGASNFGSSKTFAHKSFRMMIKNICLRLSLKSCELTINAMDIK